MRYALVNVTTEAVVDEREFNGATPPDLREREGVEWRPIQVTAPAFDAKTQVRTGPVRTVFADRVEDVFTVRAKTAQEISDERDSVVGEFDNVDSITRAAVLVIKDELNRHTTVEKALFDAIAAATSLANLQTRAAAILQVPQRSTADIRAAIRAKLGNGA